jgi:asparagine N-glycosylation enzyme membrane subunit Stt3
LFQVSIALGAVAALTRNRLVWYGSVVVGLAGAVALVAKMVG